GLGPGARSGRHGSSARAPPTFGTDPSYVLSQRAVTVGAPRSADKAAHVCLSKSRKLERRRGEPLRSAERMQKDHEEKAMNEFTFLFRGGETAASPEKMQRTMQKWMAWMNDLEAKGHLKERGNPLQPAGKVVSGVKKAVMTDGPFAEGKELVGGYTLIEAKDLEHAAELAKGCPVLEAGGSGEVVPVRKLYRGRSPWRLHTLPERRPVFVAGKPAVQVRVLRSVDRELDPREHRHAGQHRDVGDREAIAHEVVASGEVLVQPVQALAQEGLQSP